MDLQNRENFLNKLAAKMGKARAIVPEPMDAPVNTYPTERLTHLSAVDLANVSWILAFTIVSYSTIIIRKDYPNASRGFTMPGMPYLPILSILLFLVLLYGIQLSTWIIFVNSLNIKIFTSTLKFLSILI